MTEAVSNKLPEITFPIDADNYYVMLRDYSESNYDALCFKHTQPLSKTEITLFVNNWLNYHGEREFDVAEFLMLDGSFRESEGDVYFVCQFDSDQQSQIEFETIINEIIKSVVPKEM